MDYNSQRKKLILPEYGRNIQMMVDHLATITDRDERTRAAKTVISVMGNLYPHLRDVPDFRHKLWDHLMVLWKTGQGRPLQSRDRKRHETLQLYV